VGGYNSTAPPLKVLWLIPTSRALNPQPIPPGKKSTRGLVLPATPSYGFWERQFVGRVEYLDISEQAIIPRPVLEAKDNSQSFSQNS